MRRETQNVILLLVGGGLLKLALSGAYLRYVKPAQFGWVLGAGVVMCVLAVVAIAADIRRGGQARGHDEHEGHSHSFRSSWLLVLPVLAIFLVAPPALGADSVQRTQARTAATERNSTGFAELPAGNVVPMRISDFVTRAGWDANHTLRGRTVALTGFVVRRGPDVQLARMVITCCAADATPMTVRLSGTSGLRQDEWITVRGTLVEGAGERYLPEMAVADVEHTTQPREPYEY
jgi:uncharacterized repeat protein (TIGR03943 family)